MVSTAWARFRRFRIPLGSLKLSGMWLGWTLAVASTVAFSLTTPLAKAAIGLGLEPAALLVMRFAIATTLLAASLALTAPGKLRIDRRGFLLAGTAGLINGVGALTFFGALTRIDASVATMIFSLNPLLVLGVLALRGEKLTYRHTIRLALGLVGAYLLIGPSGRTDWLGVILVLGGVCGFTIELALVQWFLQEYDTRTITLYVLAGMFIAILGFWLAQGAEWRDPGWQGWLVIGVMALIGTYFGWWAMFTGIKRIGSGQMALLMPIETLLAVLWSLWLLQERLTVLQVGGSAFILASGLLAIQRLRRVRWRPRWRALLKL